jgi:hypothetical protein
MSEKKIPNPYGKKGGLEHQELIEEIYEDIEKRGFSPFKEFFLRLFRLNKKRFVDVVAKEGDNVIEFHQVGKANKDGRPVKREREVMDEIQEEYGVKVKFHAYNKGKDI